ncbi:MAG TPA: DUF1995 domain-containing protein [Cyanobacteria bacterium UBA8156]|jgi:hypothetical protein|nr:DUF1995 domain-containing protein [Cyanobacteria bacterium UBA8156]
MSLPQTLEEAAAAAVQATLEAIATGSNRLLVDIRFDEAKVLDIARPFAAAFRERYGDNWQPILADAGAAALAKREWADLNLNPRGVNEGRLAVTPEAQAFLVVAPSSVETDRLEKLMELVGDRPAVLVNPRLENAEIGVGLAARRVRERFLNRFEPCYVLQPVMGGALLRTFGGPWQVWSVLENQVLQEFGDRPSSDDLERVFRGPQRSWLAQLQGFFRALQN